jgi:peptidoglycan/xylan/chitin deacetylase (PgdA/CDA1 family)
MTLTRRSFNRLAGGLLMGAGPALATGRALAQDGSMIARHGHAPFFTAHLYPGSPITLSEEALRTRGEMVLALTFDDGPSPNTEGEILRVLAEYRAPATFFVIGRNTAQHLDALQSLVDSGHEIGNHSWSHPMLSTLSADRQQEELRRTNDVLASAGIVPSWFRPPYGDYDSLTNHIARSEQLETILWSVDSRDWKGGTPDSVARRVNGDISPGAVILMHSTKANTVAALPQILQHATANGYRFVTLSQWKEIMIRTDPIAVRMAVEAKFAELPLPTPARVAEVPRLAPEPVRAMR